MVDTQILEAVQNALVQWKFRPPIIEGKSVVVRVLQPFRFYPAGEEGVADSG